jgi:phenylalanyl-tRNA synthetase beta chain
MEIDLSFVSNTFAPINNVINAQNCELVKGVSVVDTYTDESGKSITVRISFAHPERTLTGEEVKAVTDKVIADLLAQGITLKQ